MNPSRANSLLNTWAVVAVLRQHDRYEVSLVMGKAAPWEDLQKRPLAVVSVGPSYMALPVKDSCEGKTYLTSDENGNVEQIEAEYRTSRTLGPKGISPVEADYLHVEQVGTCWLGPEQWALFRLLLLDLYPFMGRFADDDAPGPVPENHPWVMAKYDGKNPSRDFQRRVNRLVKRFKKRLVPRFK